MKITIINGIREYLRCFIFPLILLVLVILFQLIIVKFPDYAIIGHFLITSAYLIGFIVMLYSTRNEKLIIRILNLTFFILINSPLFIYTLVLIIKENTNILFRISDSSTWIGFAGSIIGGSMTMFAITFTIQQQNNIEAIKAIPSISFELKDKRIVNNVFNAVIKIEEGTKNLKPILISFEISNNSEHVAKDFKVSMVSTTNFMPFSVNFEPKYIQQETSFKEDSKIDFLLSKSKVGFSILLEHKDLDISDDFELHIQTTHSDIFNENKYLSKFKYRFYKIVSNTKDDIYNPEDNANINSLNYSTTPIKYKIVKIDDLIGLLK